MSVYAYMFWYCHWCIAILQNSHEFSGSLDSHHSKWREIVNQIFFHSLSQLCSHGKSKTRNKYHFLSTKNRIKLIWNEAVVEEAWVRERMSWNFRWIVAFWIWLNETHNDILGVIVSEFMNHEIWLSVWCIYRHIITTNPNFNCRVKINGWKAS